MPMLTEYLESLGPLTKAAIKNWVEMNKIEDIRLCHLPDPDLRHLPHMCAKAEFEQWKRDKELLPVSEIPVPDYTETLHTTFRHVL